MSALRQDLAAAAAVVRRDFLIAVSYRTRFLAQLISLFLTLTLFHFISRLVRVASFPTPDSYFAYAVVGLVILQVLTSTLSVPQGSLRQELAGGTFERLLLSPFGAVRSLLATTLFPLTYAVVTALAMLLFASVFFGVRLDWAALPLVVPIGLLGALSFAGFGVLFLAIALLTRQGLTGANYLIAGIGLVAGLYFPVSLLPAWLRWVSDVQPFTPAVDLLRHVMVDTPLHDAVGIEVLKMVGFAAVMLPLGIAAVSLTLQYSRRRGTVLEY